MGIRSNRYTCFVLVVKGVLVYIDPRYPVLVRNGILFGISLCLVLYLLHDDRCINQSLLSRLDSVLLAELYIVTGLVNLVNWLRPEILPDPGVVTVATMIMDNGSGHCNIQYTAEDDKVIEGWVRKNVGTTWHSLGTCKMGALADGGVVDADLNVHGIEGLKLVDLSIVPQNIGANAATTAYAVGEKATTIILKDLGIAVSQ
ncbi:hypothetical protein AnigIFM60653_001063 [Aspergillus niger]|nr:hypothetical protein AnigIFM60653_001063 [Aspergillus niger]